MVHCVLFNWRIIKKFCNLWTNVKFWLSHLGSKTLKALCDTHWNCRFEALRSILCDLTAIIDTLSEISGNDVEFGSDASALLRCIKTFEFVFSLILLEDVLKKTNFLSKYLQPPSLNYSLIIEMVKECINSFIELRTEEKFQQFWEKAVNISENNGFSEAKHPRVKSIP